MFFKLEFVSILPVKITLFLCCLIRLVHPRWQKKPTYHRAWILLKDQPYVCIDVWSKSHGSHQHLYPFFATNDHLLVKYGASDSDYATLKNICDNLHCSNTKFHCSGPAFSQHHEMDWVSVLRKSFQRMWR